MLAKNLEKGLGAASMLKCRPVNKQMLKQEEPSVTPAAMSVAFVPGCCVPIFESLS